MNQFNCSHNVCNGNKVDAAVAECFQYQVEYKVWSL